MIKRSSGAARPDFSARRFCAIYASHMANLRGGEAAKCVMTVRMTTSERADLDALARRARRTASELIRDMVASASKPMATTAGVLRWRRELELELSPELGAEVARAGTW